MLWAVSFGCVGIRQIKKLTYRSMRRSHGVTGLMKSRGQWRIQMGRLGRSTPWNLRKEPYSSWFCTIRKTAFAI